MPKEVEIVVETITLSTDEFLAFLPTAQQEIVKAYAKEHGVTPSKLSMN